MAMTACVFSGMNIHQKCFNLAYKRIRNYLDWFIQRKNRLVKRQLSDHDLANIWDENAGKADSIAKANTIYAKHRKKYYPELKPGANLDADKLVNIIDRINVPSEKCHYNCNGMCTNLEIQK